MKTLSYSCRYSIRFSVFTLILSVVACGGSNSEPPTEFVAQANDFANYLDWTVSDYSLGPVNIALGDAHQANDSHFARLVLENDIAQSRLGGDYPMGSILVKETFTTALGAKAHADMGGVLAMVKRGGEFNPQHNGWEWFMLSPEGTIAARGGDLMGGACNVCHALASGSAGVDYTFKKPSEHVATDADFADYRSWILVESATGDSPANGGAHAANAMRNSYKKQGPASPYFEANAYPVGTVIVKEIVQANGSIGTVYGMVKRGGGFSSASNGWEWFLLSSSNATISARSGDGGLGFCTTCHLKAGDPSLVAQDPSYRGADFVFYKKDDPVPLPN